MDLASNPTQYGKLLSERPTADTLATGTEVCKGFADLFVQMFNA
jgi:transglutaminase-like putative cysteine protease